MRQLGATVLFTLALATVGCSPAKEPPRKSEVTEAAVTPQTTEAVSAAPALVSCPNGQTPPGEACLKVEVVTPQAVTVGPLKISETCKLSTTWQASGAQTFTQGVTLSTTLAVKAGAVCDFTLTPTAPMVAYKVEADYGAGLTPVALHAVGNGTFTFSTSALQAANINLLKLSFGQPCTASPQTLCVDTTKED